MVNPRPRAAWALLAGAVAALALAPVGRATHGTPDFLENGHETPTPAGSQSGVIGDTTAQLFYANNTNATTGIGLFGLHSAATGSGAGVLGQTNSADGTAVGVNGIVTLTNPGPGSAGVLGFNNGTGGNGAGVVGIHNGSAFGVIGRAPTGTGVAGSHTASGLSGVAPGVLGWTNSTTVGASGVNGEVYDNAAGTAGVFGESFSTGAFGIGVRGAHYGGGNGVYGSVQNSVVNAAGVLGEVLGAGGGGVGIYGHHVGSGYGVYGFASGSGGAGVVGQAPPGPGWAAFFTGNVHVTGTLSKGGGAFKIDHPLDPANKYLQHSFVESPDMKNVYDGNIRTDGRGLATVTLPRYFQALNRDFRYQLTVIGEFAQAIVANEIVNNRFAIRTDRPNVKVSWQVTGIRKDRWANANRIRPEMAKPADERGRYLNPELYGVSADKSILERPPAPKVPRSAPVRLPKAQ